MESNFSLHNHAIERLQERFGVDESWLINELEEGKFFWLKGAGDCGDVKNVRYGHLLYLPHRNDYCIAVIDYRSKFVITVLTEEMALNSSWGKGLDQAAKLKAKRIALGEEAVNDTTFLRLYAEERGGELLVTVRAKTVAYDWSPIVALAICKIRIKSKQFNVETNCCSLLSEQMDEVTKSLNDKILAREIRPYCELTVNTGGGKTAFISNNLEGLSDMENAETARRWAHLT